MLPKAKHKYKSCIFTEKNKQTKINKSGLCFCLKFSPAGPDYHLEQIVGLLAESPLVLVASLPHGLLQVGEEGPHALVAVLDVGAQGERRVRQQEALGQAGVFINGRLAGWGKKRRRQMKMKASERRPTDRPPGRHGDERPTDVSLCSSAVPGTRRPPAGARCP